MIDHLKEVLIHSSNLYSKFHYAKAKSLLDPFFSQSFKLDNETLLKYSLLFSKITNRLPAKKSELKKTESLLFKTLAVNPWVKKPSHPLIFQIFLTTYSLSSIYIRQQKNHLAVIHLKKLCEIPLKDPKPIKLLTLQSRVHLSLSTVFLADRNFQDSLSFAKLALANIEEAFFQHFSCKIESLSAESLLEHKEKAVVFIFTQLNIAQNITEIKGKKSSQEYYEKALKIAGQLNDPSLAFLIKEKLLKTPNKLKKQTDGPNPLDQKQRKASLFGSGYYSPEKLKKISNFIESGQKFLSSDEYFRRKITKKLGLENHRKKTQSVSQSEDLEKKVLTSIRQKKHQKTKSLAEFSEDLDKKIELLHNESEKLLNRQSVKIQSTLKTRIGRNIFKNISAKNSFCLPQKRLFFKPPIEREVESKRSPEKKESLVLFDLNSTSRLKEIARSELENLMQNVNRDLRITLKKEGKEVAEGKLAISAQKGLSQMREQNEALVRNLANAILGSRKRHLRSTSFKSFLEVK